MSRGEKVSMRREETDFRRKLPIGRKRNSANLFTAVAKKVEPTGDRFLELRLHLSHLVRRLLQVLVNGVARCLWKMWGTNEHVSCEVYHGRTAYDSPRCTCLDRSSTFAQETRVPCELRRSHRKVSPVVLRGPRTRPPNSLQYLVHLQTILLHFGRNLAFVLFLDLLSDFRHSSESLFGGAKNRSVGQLICSFGVQKKLTCLVTLSLELGGFFGLRFGEASCEGWRERRSEAGPVIPVFPMKKASVGSAAHCIVKIP